MREITEMGGSLVLFAAVSGIVLAFLMQIRRGRWLAAGGFALVMPVVLWAAFALARRSIVLATRIDK